MYNILELRRKSQDELLQIAQELGVKKANSLAPDALIYAILDQQAIVTSVDKKDDGKAKKQRTRIAKKVVTEEGGINVIERKPKIVETQNFASQKEKNTITESKIVESQNLESETKVTKETQPKDNKKPNNKANNKKKNKAEESIVETQNSVSQKTVVEKVQQPQVAVSAEKEEAPQQPKPQVQPQQAQQAQQQQPKQQNSQNNNKPQQPQKDKKKVETHNFASQ